MLNTTNEILLPTSIVAIKLDGSLVTPEIILDIKDPVFLSISNFNLLDAINAISLPEKNAERHKDIRITVNNIIKNKVFRY